MRIWRSSPGVAITAVIALAMGIGFTTTMFSIVHGATRSLPFDDPDELVAIQKIPARGAPGSGDARPFDYRAWRDEVASFESLGAYESLSVNLAGDASEPERVSGAAITASAFDMLGVQPFVGRTLLASDMRPGAAAVVVLSHALWQRRFADDADIVGRTIRLTGTPHVVVGVMPPRFAFPINAALWTPLMIDTSPERTSGPVLQVFGRLADGASIDSARPELETVTRRTHAAAGGGDQALALRVDVVPFQDVETPRDVVRALYLMVLAVSFVLLIACGNVANLFIARAAVRARDFALSLALGATRARLVREQLVETLSIALIATAAGIGLAHIGTRLFATNTAHIIEAFWVEFRVDPVVVGFAAALAAAATLAAGLGPALLTTRRNLADVLKDGGVGNSGLAIGRLGRGLIAVQVTLACGLLALTMVLARTSVTIRSIAWPFDPHSILTFELDLGRQAPQGPSEEYSGRLERLSAALSDTPGVAAAGLVTALPGRGAGEWTFSLDEAVRQSARTTSVTFVSSGFFAVSGTHAITGRLLTPQDDASAQRVVVVNESFVRTFSPDANPIGRRVFLGQRDFTIVGIVPDLMARDVQDRRRDGVYASILQSGTTRVRVMARAAQPDAPILSALRASLRRVESDAPVTEIFSLHEAVYRDKKVLDILSTLFSVFGVGALALTAIGLYGVVSFGVTQRTRELGIRMALGATRGQVLALVVRQGSRQIVIGLIAGSLLALALSRAFAAAVEQLPGPDAPLLLLIVSTLALTSLAALALPARRAARLQIVSAIRDN
jgi:putative ABC transport system permease protein